MSRHDVVVVGGGHNAITAAAYLARAGRSVLLLEQADRLGGATQSVAMFPGLDLTLRRRRTSSYTPDPADPRRGLVVDTGDTRRTAGSFAGVGAADDAAAWHALGRRTGELARAVFPHDDRPGAERGGRAGRSRGGLVA